MGQKGCTTEPDFLRYVVFVPKGTTIPATNLLSQSAFTTYVTGKLQSATRSTRWYISPLLGEFKDNTDAIKEKDFDGYKVLSQMMPYNWEWRLAPGSFCANKKLKTFHQQHQNYDCFIIDANGLWIGWEDPAAVGIMKALTLDSIIIFNWGPKVSGDTNKYGLKLAFADNKQLNEYLNGFTSTTSPALLDGLTDVYLYQGVDTAGSAIANTTSYIYVRGMMACGGSNMGDYFGTDLAATSAWTVVNSSGTPVSLTGVTYNSTTGNFRLASSTAFTSAATFYVTLASVSTLVGLNPSATLVTETSFSVTIP